MKKIVVNDTNIFIDLLEVGLLDEFFLLSWEIHTTDFIMRELLKDGQKDAVARFADNGKLHVAKFDGKEILEIITLHRTIENKTNVSMADCSVWYYARVNKYSLLTGDRKLRSTSHKDGLEVHGILYVFDSLVEEKIISGQVAAEKLSKLKLLNPRLPEEEINNRIIQWGGEIIKKGDSL